MQRRHAYKLSLRAALKDLGWFPAAFTTVVGGPSLLALMQIVREGFRLSAPLQWIVDGYNALTSEIAAWIEPLVVPAVAWINGLLGWRLVLHPHWRPLFLLGLVAVVALVRGNWSTGSRTNLVLEAVQFGIMMLIAALLAGLVPFTEDWWAQGLIAAIPVMTFFTLMGFLSAAQMLAAGQRAEARTELRLIVGAGAPLLGTATFALAALLSLVAPGAAVWVIACAVAAMGLFLLRSGLAEGDPQEARTGLIMLGGFVAAGLILAADAGVKALG